MGKKKKKRTDDALKRLGDAWTLYNAFLIILGIVLFFSSLLAWGYVIAEAKGACRSILRVEIVVQILVLAGSILRIGMFDYEEHFAFHVAMTLFVSTVFTLIGFLIAGIHILEIKGTLQTASFQYMTDFLIQILAAIVLGFLPALLTATLMWLIVRTVAKTD